MYIGYDEQQSELRRRMLTIAQAREILNECCKKYLRDKNEYSKP